MLEDLLESFFVFSSKANTQSTAKQVQTKKTKLIFFIFQTYKFTRSHMHITYLYIIYQTCALLNEFEANLLFFDFSTFIVKF